MQNQKKIIRPYLIGIAGGSYSGKRKFVEEVSKLITEFSVTKICLEDYNTVIPTLNSKNEETNPFLPESYDFTLLAKNLESLRQGESVKAPKLEPDGKKIEITLEPSPVILFEGTLAFYDPRIRNLMDLRIFIDIDSDIRLGKRIAHDINQKNFEFIEDVRRYVKYVKPVYDTYIDRTKEFADAIILKSEDNEIVFKIISEFLKSKLQKILEGDFSNLFSSDDEVIDPKFKFFNQKIIVPREKTDVSMIKQVLIDSITNVVDEDFKKQFRKNMISILPKVLLKDFQAKNLPSDSLLKAYDIITEGADLSKKNFSELKTVIYFRTFILNENDLADINTILKANSKINLFVNSVFLAPKFSEIILKNILYSVSFNTLYFSDFFILFEESIRNENGFYSKTEFDKMFREFFKKEFIDVLN